MRKIDPAELTLRPFHLLDQERAILVGGRDRPNPMTVAWGGFGTLWKRPVVTVYVRPVRHTFALLNQHPEFTLNFLPHEHRAALQFCGTRSGRDQDKWAGAGLTQQRSEQVSVPRVTEARLAFECRALATLDVDPTRFLEPSIEELYPQKDYHRLFMGEVLAVWAESPSVL